MKKILYFILLASLIINLVGCNNNDDKKDDKANEGKTEQTENKGGAEKENSEQALPDLAEQKTVEIMLEGMPENKVVKLYHHKKLGFSTYVPDDMTVESNPEIFNVFANFGGTENKDATLKITGQTEEEVTKNLQDNGFTLGKVEVKAFDFTDKEFSLNKEGMIGHVAFFKHGNDDYAIYYYFPKDYAEGFGPRSDIIIKEIKWHDEQS
ncbi:hypothetical protein [Schinkia azotoformans]|uniref:hypothetical protein n=1 Tax=Schinkia azotoformans TaxID=1454 RepID=UPI002DC00591|nr:hypothetical protein [Schinkia azotoformans]MEC1696342.1 hypothetical protein [Schinkia azotoformans]MEC1727300.1 hypothetical protein [Schinkia azotoformans]MEC1770776.1 hypothetical protein [Schinkia azotoformans]MEC1780860.1 hypothetical protein [Schinkia azotoformans]MED4331739.1 hypothetical protein [Schinkia azotoformans]